MVRGKERVRGEGVSLKCMHAENGGWGGTGRGGNGLGGGCWLVAAPGCSASARNGLGRDRGRGRGRARAPSAQQKRSGVEGMGRRRAASGGHRPGPGTDSRGPRPGGTAWVPDGAPTGSPVCQTCVSSRRPTAQHKASTAASPPQGDPGPGGRTETPTKCAPSIRTSRLALRAPPTTSEQNKRQSCCETHVRPAQRADGHPSYSIPAAFQLYP